MAEDIAKEILGLVGECEYEAALAMLPMLRMTRQRTAEEKQVLQQRLASLKSDVEALKKNVLNQEKSLGERVSVSDPARFSPKPLFDLKADWDSFVSELGDHPDAVEKTLLHLKQEHATLAVKNTRLLAAIQAVQCQHQTSTAKGL